jgi:hypothetical protein
MRSTSPSTTSPSPTPDTVQVWADVETGRPMARRVIGIFGTGHEVPRTMVSGDGTVPFVHVGTVTTAGGALVWHVFDGGEL